MLEMARQCINQMLSKVDNNRIRRMRFAPRCTFSTIKGPLPISYKDEINFYTEFANVRRLSQSIGEWLEPMLQKLSIVNNNKTKSKQHLQYLLDEATNVLPTYNLSEKRDIYRAQKQPKVRITHPPSNQHQTKPHTNS